MTAGRLQKQHVAVESWRWTSCVRSWLWGYGKEENHLAQLKLRCFCGDLTRVYSDQVYCDVSPKMKCAAVSAALADRWHLEDIQLLLEDPKMLTLSWIRQILESSVPFFRFCCTEDEVELGFDVDFGWV